MGRHRECRKVDTRHTPENGVKRMFIRKGDTPYKEEWRSAFRPHETRNDLARQALKKRRCAGQTRHDNHDQ